MKFLLIAVAVLTLMPLAGNAQEMKVSVPFAFSVDNHQMPSGDYVLKMMTANTLLITSEDGTTSRVTLTGAAGGGTQYKEPRLTFRKTGEQYDLQAAWFGHGNAGRRVPTPKPSTILRGEDVTIASN